MTVCRAWRKPHGGQAESTKTRQLFPLLSCAAESLGAGLAGLIVQGKRADAGSLFEPALHPARQGANIRRMAGFSFFPCHEPDGFLDKAR